MHIHIIGRHLEPAVNFADPLLKQGRQWVLRGHQVTVLTGSSDGGMELGRKKIGLLQSEGMTVVILKMPPGSQVSKWLKHFLYKRFAANLEKQGQLLPKPDLIFAVMPPLEIARAALKLKSVFNIPVVLEFREALPDYKANESNIIVRLRNKIGRGFEEKTIEEAAQLVAASDAIATSLREHLSDQGKSKVKVIGKGLDEGQLSEAYERILREAKIDKELN
jgi:hypothetical protein